MSDAPTEIDASMLLCDHAQSVGGKLYVLGGGWTQVKRDQWNGTLALAINIAVPWDRTNEPIRLRANLLTEDGEPVSMGNAPVQAEGNMEVGRPPGVRRGTPLGASVALNFQGLQLDPGGYVWELEVAGDVRERVAFQVVR